MKKGFVLYFDNCRRLQPLSDALYSAVMRATVEYAQRLAEEDDQEAFLERQRKTLPPEGAMALDFMAVALRRDHEKYRDTVHRREQQRERRPAKQTPDTPWGSREMQAYVRELHGSSQAAAGSASAGPGRTS